MRGTKRLVAAVAAMAMLVGLQPAVTADAAPTVAMTYAADGAAMVGPDGELARRVVLELTNPTPDYQIVLVTVYAPLGAEFATAQTAPAGWIASWTRTTVEFAGTLGEGEALFTMRVRGDVPDAPFAVHILTAQPGIAFPPIDAKATPAEGARVCQVVALSGAGGAWAAMPVASLSEKADTSAAVAVGVFDAFHGEYVNAGAVTGIVTVGAWGGDASTSVSLSTSIALPVLDTLAGPVLGGADTLPFAAAVLWDGDDEGRFFLDHPGAFALTGTATDACTASYALDASLTPTGEAAAPTPFAVLPPEIDSDGDGVTNANEVRANSHPLAASSTPYTDDDCDGVPNGRDAVTVPLCTVI